MKITFTPQNFRGYDAAPIKNLYMGMLTDNYDRDIFDDLKIVTDRENIGLHCLTGEKIFSSPPQKWTGDRWGLWNQDSMYFTQEEGQTKVHPSQKYKLPQNLEKSFKNIGIKQGENYSNIAGGNFFFGKKENGEPYILVGRNSIREAKHIAEGKGIKEENIFIVSQGAYHIDMIMRPIGFPYILINDIDLTVKNIDDLDITTKEKGKLKKEIEGYMSSLKEDYKPSSGKEIAKELEAQGFKPILIGGVYQQNVNFMNAIVHKRNDGKLVYITNSAENIGKNEYEFQKMFERELREKVPNLAKIDFIIGKEAKAKKDNYIQTFLQLGGGIHCLCTEEPDFEKWA